jgi:hypothetical protein
MKILIISILLALCTCSIGQTNQSKLKLLEIKAKNYLTEMYGQQNFDVSYKKWHKSVLTDIAEIYKKNSKTFADNLSLINQVKSDYHTFFTTNKKFTLLKFDYENIDKEGGKTIAYFKYSFNEEVNGQDTNSSSYIYFVCDNTQDDWKIFDFRVTAILGDSTRWMK